MKFINRWPDNPRTWSWHSRTWCLLSRTCVSLLKLCRGLGGVITQSEARHVTGSVESLTCQNEARNRWVRLWLIEMWRLSSVSVPSNHDDYPVQVLSVISEWEESLLSVLCCLIQISSILLSTDYFFSDHQLHFCPSVCWRAVKTTLPMSLSSLLYWWIQKKTWCL